MTTNEFTILIGDLNIDLSKRSDSTNHYFFNILNEFERLLVTNAQTRVQENSSSCIDQYRNMTKQILY